MGTDDRKPVLGITGGVGAGKSTAAGALADLGCAIVDADVVGHEIIQTPPVRRALVARWGEDICDGEGRVDRRAVGGIVFADAAELAFLTAQMHPPMGARIGKRIAAARRRDDVRGVVLDAAVLFEAGWDALCTHTVFVSAPRGQRLERAAGRGWDAAAVARREKMQFSLDTKSRMCDYTVENSSSVSCLCKQVRTLFREILHSVERS
ncbi:MAG: dephospho-CoA kinase [Phycisphaerae bacterium]|nr:dephospho-CoA kinase [Phycisphaerae bacterium]